jgi:hypothetical protein
MENGCSIIKSGKAGHAGIGRCNRLWNCCKSCEEKNLSTQELLTVKQLLDVNVPACVRMLRYYDDSGLVKPEKIDEFTGYRYYSESQLPAMWKINTLKDM